jgi:anion-transporting  ArsA/GET3 family ATPase
MSAARAGTIETLLGSREIVVTCGPGGVGKTTTAAAAGAMAASRIGGRVLVLTVDPARRLADALGLKGIGNEVTEVPAKVFADAGLPLKGSLHAAMLDTKQSWDALIARHAPDEATRDRILDNPLYQNITGRFIQSHDYIAMERLYELHSTGEWDLIVVDTPPTRNALDFLDAPARMADFFSSRLLRWLIAPARSSLLNLASKPFTQIADRILGTQFLSDIAEFFLSMQSMYEGFVDRANAVARLMADERTSFLVVSSSETVPLREAEFFSAELAHRKLDVGAVILNKVLPEALSDPDALATAEVIEQRHAELAATLAGPMKVDEAVLDRVLLTVTESYSDFAVVARREAAARERFASEGATLITIPNLEGEISDMTGLAQLGGYLFSG